MNDHSPTPQAEVVARLRTAVGKVSPDEWYSGQHRTELTPVRKVVADLYHHQGPIVCDTGYSGDEATDRKIADYIAAANPSAILALLNALDSATAREAELSAAMEDAERYRQIRECGYCDSKHGNGFALDSGSRLKAVFAFRYWCTPEELDSKLDAFRSIPARAGAVTVKAGEL